MIIVTQVDPKNITLKEIMDGSKLYYICKTCSDNGNTYAMKAISDITNMQDQDVTFVRICEVSEEELHTKKTDDVIPPNFLDNLLTKEVKEPKNKEYYSRSVYLIDKTVKGIHADVRISTEKGAIIFGFFSKEDAEFYREKIWKHIYASNKDFTTCSDIYEIFGIADYNKHANKYGWYSTEKHIVSDIRKKKNINIWSMSLARPEQI